MTSVVRSSIRHTAALVVAGLIATVAACTPTLPPRTGTGPARYVALGDSMSAVPFLTLPVGEPVGCGRSATNWPAVVARDLDVRDLVDVSCSSAASVHLFEPQSTAPLGIPLGTNPAQLDAVTADTELITVTIGANDVRFIDDLLEACRTDVPTPPVGPCRDRWVTDGSDRFSERIRAAVPGITTGLRAVRDRAPGATVLVVGYPTYFPADVASCEGLVPLAPADVAYARDELAELNAAVAEAAAAVGVRFVDTAGPSTGHDMCRPGGEAWVNRFSGQRSGAPLHADDTGNAALAAVVTAAAREAR